MRGSLKIGRIAGISVEIHYTWLLIFGLVTYFLGTSMSGKASSEIVVWVVAVATSLVFFGSVLAHELSHSLVANAYTDDMVRRITLFAFGGVAHLKDEPPSGKAELWVAVAGPGMSLALAAVFGGIVVLLRLAPASLDIIRSAFLYLSAINVLLAIFNMIPAFPLDGGRVLRALIWIGTGQFDRATQIAAGAGQVFAWLFMAFGVFQILQGPGNWFSGLWILAIGWMLSSAAQGSLRRLSIERALSGVQVGQIMTTPAVSAGADWSVQRLVYEVILPQRIREVPITWAGQVQGVVNATDVQQVPQQNWPTMSVTQVMSPLSDDRIIPPQEPATKALKVVGAGHGRAYV
ncbi:MAG: peptidase M50, partial [Armatimonadia bacterium]|nr:peptidase M50 [Armatimonadia bacterium]